MSQFTQCTEQEEEFARHYAIHRRPSKAYRHAYHTDGWDPQMVATEAQKVMHRPRVALRIHQLQTIAEEEFKVNVKEKKFALQKIIDHCGEIIKVRGEEKMRDAKAVIAAIAELNKMDGDLAVQKKHVTGEIGINIDSDDDEL